MDQRSIEGTAASGGRLHQGSGGYSQLRDEELMPLLCRRDVQAFETLYDRYGDLVFSVALRILGDAAAAEDVVQDVFLRLWRRPESYSTERGRFLTWLLSVTRNRAIDERRVQGRRLKHEVGPVAPQMETTPTAEADDPALSAVLADERQAIRSALAAIPAEQRQVILLAYFSGLTQQEIAAHLGQPLGTVKTRLRLGMQKLRAALAQTTERYQLEQ